MASDVQIYCDCMARIRHRVNIVQTIVSGGIQIQLNGIYMNPNTQCTIDYGISGFNSGATAPGVSWHNSVLG